MFNQKSEQKNEYMAGRYRKGYDWWWHSFTGKNKVTGEERAFFIEFFIVNPKLSPKEVVLGQGRTDGKKPSYLMVKCGSWGQNKKQLHRFFPIGETKITKRPFSVSAGDCYVDDTHVKGSVSVTESTVANMSDVGSMSFDLTIDKKIAFDVGYGTSPLFVYLKAFEMYWHAQGMKSGYTGTVTFDGEEYVVTDDTSFGYADKNWGKDFTSPWIWLSSNHIRRKSTGEWLQNSVFDIGGGKPKVFGISIPSQLLGAYYFEGVEYEMNFSKFWLGTKTEFRCRETDTEIVWVVYQTNRTHKIITEIHCKKEDMLFVNYESPEGLKLHKRLWNGGTGYGNIKLYKRGHLKFTLEDEFECFNTGCEYGKFET